MEGRDQNLPNANNEKDNISGQLNDNVSKTFDQLRIFILNELENLSDRTEINQDDIRNVVDRFDKFLSVYHAEILGMTKNIADSRTAIDKQISDINIKMAKHGGISGGIVALLIELIKFIVSHSDKVPK